MVPPFLFVDHSTNLSGRDNERTVAGYLISPEKLSIAGPQAIDRALHGAVSGFHLALPLADDDLLLLNCFSGPRGSRTSDSSMH